MLKSLFQGNFVSLIVQGHSQSLDRFRDWWMLKGAFKDKLFLFLSNVISKSIRGRNDKLSDQNSPCAKA